MTSTNWVTAGLTLSLWNGVLTLWDVRNKEYHGHDDATTQAAERKRLMLEATTSISFLPQLSPSDQHWLAQTPTTYDSGTIFCHKLEGMGT